jgi:hypothetical protein
LEDFKMSSFVTVNPSLILRNNTTKDIRIFGMKIKAGKKLDIFKSVVGLTEAQVIAAMSPPHGEIYTKIQKGEITALTSTFATFENDLGTTIYDTRVVTSNFTASEGTVILCDATDNPITVTLPRASTLVGRVIHVKKIDDSENIVTIVPQGSDKIDGDTSITIEDLNVTYTFVSSGTNYFII